MMNRSCVVALCAAIAFVAAPAYAGITVSLKPARTSGVSPLYVFFDATGTTSTDVSDPFGDLLYQWNFGDANPVSGGGAVWKVSGKLKNTATGPLAAHVYECAGPSNCTATVTLTVRAPDGVVNSATTTITVYPASYIDGSTPGSKTVCVSASGDFTGCPNGAARVVSSAGFASILSSEIDGSGMRRVLFRRGDTWTASGNYALQPNGPGIIGAFGDPSQPKPFVKAVTGLNNQGLIQCYGFNASGVGHGRDWRIMDLQIQGGPNPAQNVNGSFFDTTYGLRCEQVLLYRLDVVNTPNNAFKTTFSTNVFHLPGNGLNHDQVALVESTANYNYGMHLWWSGSHSALLGDSLGDSAATHAARVACADEMVIEDSRFYGAQTTRHELKLHAQEQACPNNISKDIEISDNKFESSKGSDWSVTLTGNHNNYTDDERVEDLIFERNWVGPTGIGTTNDGTSQVGVVVGTMHGIYRNNIMVGTGGFANPYQSFDVFSEASKYTPTNNQFYDNTCFAGDAGTRKCVVVSSGIDTLIRDNLLYKPNPTEGGSPSAVAVCGGSNCTADHNIAEIGASATLPFLTNSPVVPSDFELRAGVNPAVGVGAAVPVLVDFGLRMRGASRDVGAWSFEVGSTSAPAAPVLLP